MKLKLISPVWNKSHLRFYLRDQIMASFITILLCYLTFIFIIPMMLGGKGRYSDESKKVYAEVYTGILNNQAMILLFGGALAVLVNILIQVAKDKPMIVAIEIENDEYKLTTRRPKKSSLKIQSGNLKNLRIVKDKTKVSPLEGAYVCYKFYNDDDYLGLFMPEHFVWNDVPKLKVVNALNTISPIIEKRKAGS